MTESTALDQFGIAREAVESLKAYYRSGESDLGRDFFAPCLASCNTYDRAVGYFSSSVLRSWLEALPRIAQNPEVKIRLLASPEVSTEDKAALENAVDEDSRRALREMIADRLIEGLLDAADQANAARTLKIQAQLLAWLIANERLEIRFAFPQHVDHPGIFHEKIGVFNFPWGERLAFTGSANETSHGHALNYETIDVFRSWIEADKGRVETKEAQFEDAWMGNAPGLFVLPLGNASISRLKAREPQIITDGRELAKRASDAHKWRHQDDALRAFIAAKRGVLEMATGTGKTKTAIKILEFLLQQGEIDGVVISTDGVDLLDQWRKEIDQWQLQREKPLRVFRHYGAHHEIEKFALKPKGAIIVVSREALSKLFRQLPAIDRGHLAIVHDEVHGLGSPSMRDSLAGQHKFFGYRLGLSATPEREYDDEGSTFIFQELGEVIFRFGLQDAIERGILCPFEYLPLDYELTDEDRQRLKAVYNREAARRQSGNPMTKEEVWTEISKVYKTAEMKPAVFAEFITNRPELLQSCIVFVENKEYGERVLNILHRYTHRYRTYYAEDDRQHLVDFAAGKIDCLVTCHRISQGIDIQHLKHVILFSSARAKLETIQRIGRCIRSDPSNPNKRAVVVDFVRPADPADMEPNADQARLEWLESLSKVNRKD